MLALAEGLLKIRSDISEARANLVYLFWLGQFAAIAALMGVMLRWAGR